IFEFASHVHLQLSYCYSMRHRLKSPRNVNVFGRAAHGLFFCVALLPYVDNSRAAENATPPAVGATPPTGIAAQYPRDEGIERDPRVLLAENFEVGSIADLSKHWSDVGNRDNKILSFN